MKVSVIIPNWNGAEKLKKNLPEVLKLDGIEEVVVIDDKSTDQSVDLIENDFKDVVLIKKEQNSGFSSTVNLGVKKSKGDLVFLLNTDAVARKDCLKNLVKHFKDSNVFSVSCNTGGSWSWAKFEDGYFWHYADDSVKKVSHQTLWASGGSGLFKKNIWEELGGFDTLYDPFYEEDVDLGYRATKRGYINIWEPEALVEHYKEPGVISLNFSTDHIKKIAQRNQLIFIWKNITSEDLTSKHRKKLYQMILSHPKYSLVVLSALTKISQVNEKRKQEKLQAKLTDEEILGLF